MAIFYRKWYIPNLALSLVQLNDRICYHRI